MPVRIVTDSGCDLSLTAAEEHRIEVVPLSIRFGDTEYTDRTGLTPPEFYALMESHDELPETAAPAPGQFVEAFKKMAAEGADEVVCINLSAALSATGQSARNAAEAVKDDITVHCVDSKSLTVGLGTLTVLAARDAAEGLDGAAIVANTEERSKNTRVFGALDTLENLKKGGRIGGAQALLGNMLSIKPCLDLSSGEVEEAGKQRTRKKALGWLRQQVAEAGEISELVVGHAQASDIDPFLAQLQELPNVGDIRVETIGPVVGTHGGPALVGVSWIQG